MEDHQDQNGVQIRRVVPVVFFSLGVLSIILIVLDITCPMCFAPVIQLLRLFQGTTATSSAAEEEGPNAAAVAGSLHVVGGGGGGASENLGASLELPIIAYSSSSTTDGDDDQENLITCAVCLAEFKEGEKCRLLPKCRHIFHVQCIDAWLSSRSTCPLCRRSTVIINDHDLSV